jgi:uncharacterized glyoxalase superfamily protein PhnB
MKVEQVAAAYAVADVSGSAAWVAEHLGFEVLVDLGWYASTRHPDSAIAVDYVDREHGTGPHAPEAVTGSMLALVIDAVDEEHERLAAAGVEVLAAPRTEPWGQRRCQVAGPGGLVVELVQPVAPDPEWMAAQGLDA